MGGHPEAPMRGPGRGVGEIPATDKDDAPRRGPRMHGVEASQRESGPLVLQCLPRLPILVPGCGHIVRCVTYGDNPSNGMLPDRAEEMTTMSRRRDDQQY